MEINCPKATGMIFFAYSDWHYLGIRCYFVLLFYHLSAEKDVGNMEMAHEGMVWSLAWHPLGHILCSGSNDHSR